MPKLISGRRYWNEGYSADFHVLYISVRGCWMMTDNQNSIFQVKKTRAESESSRSDHCDIRTCIPLPKL